MLPIGCRREQAELEGGQSESGIASEAGEDSRGEPVPGEQSFQKSMLEECRSVLEYEKLNAISGEGVVAPRRVTWCERLWAAGGPGRDAQQLAAKEGGGLRQNRSALAVSPAPAAVGALSRLCAARCVPSCWQYARHSRPEPWTIPLLFGHQHSASPLTPFPASISPHMSLPPPPSLAAYHFSPAEGTYGVVFRARDKSNGRVLALKRIKLEAFRYGFPQTSIREINILLSLHHRNIVNVLEVRGARGGCDRLVLQGDVRVVPAVERTWSPLLLGLHLTCPLCLPPLALSHALPLPPVPIPFTLSSSNQTPPVLSSCLLLTCPLPVPRPPPRALAPSAPLLPPGGGGPGQQQQAAAGVHGDGVCGP